MRIGGHYYVSIFVVLVVLAFALAPALAHAQGTMPFSVQVNYTAGNITISNLFYYIQLSAKDGLRASSWYVNVSPTRLLPLIKPNSLEVPTPLIAISRPNSTSISLPGALSSSQWNVTVVSSSSDMETIKLTPANSSLTYPFILNVYITVGRLEPYITYTISIANSGNSPAYLSEVFGIGSSLSGRWASVVQYIDQAGALSVATLANNTYVSGQVRSAAAVYFNGTEPSAIIGVSYISSPASVTLLQGKLFGLPVNQTFILLNLVTPTLAPGQTYNVTFVGYSVAFEPFEIASVGGLPLAEYLDPGVAQNISTAVNAKSVISSLNSTISSLNATIRGLNNEVNDLDAKLFYYVKQLNMTKSAESYYMELSHRGGVLAAGMFIAGIVIGVLGGAFFLSPRYTATRQQPRKTTR